jgi:autotransporter passenger strand-loop-strand repeat protein
MAGGSIEYGSLTNLGTLEDTAAGITYVATTISNSGTIEVVSGTLLFEDGGSLSGPVTGLGVLELGDGVFTLGAGFSHTGQLNIDSNATITLGGTADFLSGPTTIDGALFAGPGTLATTGVITVENSARFSSGAAWSNSGTVNLSSGDVISASFTNASGGVVDLAGGSIEYGSLTNLGTLEDTAAGITYVDETISNSGTTEVVSGTLFFEAGGNSVGTLKVFAGATLEFAGTAFAIDGNVIVLSDGVVSGATINSGGNEYVSSGGVSYRQKLVTG